MRGVKLENDHLRGKGRPFAFTVLEQPRPKPDANEVSLT